jgi:hypothetical protein
MQRLVPLQPSLLSSFVSPSRHLTAPFVLSDEVFANQSRAAATLVLHHASARIQAEPAHDQWPPPAPTYTRVAAPRMVSRRSTIPPEPGCTAAGFHFIAFHAFNWAIFLLIQQA